MVQARKKMPINIRSDMKVDKDKDTGKAAASELVKHAKNHTKDLSEEGKKSPQKREQ